MAVNLEWVGLACFRLWEDGGSAIAMDPYDSACLAEPCGLEDHTILSLRLQADTLIVSSLTDKAHSYQQAVEGDPRVINALDVAQGKLEAKINGEPLIAVQAAEAPHHPEGPDDNALYAFKAGDLWFLHMGDLGYGIYEEELAPFAGHCDVLLTLVGEDLTLTLDQLEPMIDILDPTWIVPMHYNCPPITAHMSKVEVFLRRRSLDPIIHARHHTVTFPLPTLGDRRPTIVVLEPSAYQTTEKLL